MKIIKEKLFFYPSSNFVVLLFMLFLVVFPKGGIKIHNIPITWGYSSLGIVSLFLLFRKEFLIKKEHVFILICLIPFQIFSIISFGLNGIENIGFTISFIIGFFFLPFIFLFILSEYIQKLNLDYFFKIFKRSLLFISSYGIFLFFYKLLQGSFLEIPFLTINYHEIGMIEQTKFIDRGSVYKLISTYNNGNLYGICLLMTLPFYNSIEKNQLKKNIVKFSLVVTLSRTVWIGLIISECFYDLFIRKNKSLAMLKFLLTLILFVGILISIGIIFDFPLTWFFDKTLGNRINSEAFFNVELFSTLPFKQIQEILYLGILQSFGYIGLILFLIAIFSPIIIFSVQNLKKRTSSINRCIFLGLITYLIISTSDSALLYIPILSFFWFFSSLLFVDIKDRN